jgi:uncharacterized phage-associated protein
MIIDHSHEKLIQTVVFFAKNVKKLGKVKLFKLLFFVDFMHYKDTGRSVTGLEYSAWPKGPVPVTLKNALDFPDARWDGKVEFKKVATRNGEMLTVNAMAEFDPLHFSRRELKLLESLASEFYNSTADEMIEKTHLENSPWHKIWEVEGRRQEVIPYDYALRAQDADAVRSLANERQELLAVLSKK